MTDKTICESIIESHNVMISEYAFEKMNAYSRIVSSVIGCPTEVMGFLIGEPDDPSCTAFDALLRMEQNVEGARAYPDGNSFAKAYAEARNSDKRIVGMWHSHGRLPNFHSDDDDNHLLDVLCNNSFYLKTRLHLEGLQVPYASSIVINQDSYLRDSPCSDPLPTEHYFACAAFKDKEGTQIVEDLEIGMVDTGQSLEDHQLLVNDVCKNVKHNGTYLAELRQDSQEEEVLGYPEIPEEYLSTVYIRDAIFRLLIAGLLGKRG